MNEQDWLTCDDPIPMLDFLLTGCGSPFDSVSGGTGHQNEENHGIRSWKVTQRKLRLFACACMRRVNLFSGPACLQAIGISEQYADGLVDKAALEKAFVPARKLPEPIPLDADMALSVFGPTDMVREARLIDDFLTLGPELDVRGVAMKAAELITENFGADSLSRRGRDERSQQTHLLRRHFRQPVPPCGA